MLIWQVVSWSVKVKVNIQSYFTSCTKLWGTSVVGAKLYRLLVLLFRTQWLKASWEGYSYIKRNTIYIV